MNRSKIVKAVVALLVLVAGAFLFYTRVYLPKSTYAVYHPQKGSVAVEIFGIGELEAKDIYAVGTPVGGKVLTVETDQGRTIHKGDVIAKLDPVDLEKKRDAAVAALERAKIDLDATKKQLQITKDRAALAISTYEKDLKLYRAKGISRLAFEKSKTAMMTARAEVAVAQSRVKSATIGLREVQDNIEGIEKRLALLTILSPADGYVIAKNVLPGQSIPLAFAIVKIVVPQTLWIKAWIDERISGKVKEGQKAKITLRSREDQPFAGVVRRIAVVSDPVTQEREVDVGFFKIPEPFYINEQAEVRILVQKHDGLYKIPLRYFTVYKGKKGIWIRENGKAHFLVPKIVAEDEQYAGVREGVDESTEILVPDRKKKPLFEGSSVST